MKTKKFDIGTVKIEMQSNGFAKGLILKRDVSLRECKHIMKNILGFDYENMKKLTEGEDIHIHDYHKSEVRELRKMAHVTFTNLKLLRIRHLHSQRVINS